MRVYVEVISGSCPSLHIGERFPLRVAPESSVLETRRRISERLSIPIYTVILGFNNSVLEDGEELLQEKGIGNNAVLSLHLLPDCNGGYNTTKLDGLLGSTLLNFGTSCGIAQIQGVPCLESAEKTLRTAPSDYIENKGLMENEGYANVLVSTEAAVSGSPTLYVSSAKGLKAQGARAVRKRNLIAEDTATEMTVVRFT